MTSDGSASSRLDLPGDAVAAGQAARSVDQDSFQRPRLDFRHADLGRAFLVEPLDARAALGMTHGKPRPRIDALRRKLRHLAGRHQHRNNPLPAQFFWPTPIFAGIVGHRRPFVENFPYCFRLWGFL